MILRQRYMSFFSLLLLLLFTTRRVYASLSLSVESGVEECVSFWVKDATDMIRGNFDVLDDELDASDVTVEIHEAHSSHDILWKSTRDESEETFHIPAKTSGRHLLCVRNADKYYDRTVGIALRVTSPPRALDSEEEGPDQERASELLDWSEDLLDDWDSLADHYEYLKMREAQHRNILEKIFERVIRWTLLEALTLICIATAQVLYIRKFLETKRYL